MNTSLTTFPEPLLRLILSGGGGLPRAWGPLDGSEIGGSCERAPWNPVRERVYSDRAVEFWPLEEPEGWALPLGADSPWPARLALVAAWMAKLHNGAGYAEVVKGKIHARGAFSRDEHESVSVEWSAFGVSRITSWDCRDGLHYRRLSAEIYDLRSLPQHLQAHSPTVALLLALYDVPEIGARVENP